MHKNQILVLRGLFVLPYVSHFNIKCNQNSITKFQKGVEKAIKFPRILIFKDHLLTYFFIFKSTIYCYYLAHLQPHLITYNPI